MCVCVCLKQKPPQPLTFATCGMRCAPETSWRAFDEEAAEEEAEAEEEEVEAGEEEEAEGLGLAEEGEEEEGFRGVEVEEEEVGPALVTKSRVILMISDPMSSSLP